MSCALNFSTVVLVIILTPDMHKGDVLFYFPIQKPLQNNGLQYRVNIWNDLPLILH